MHYPKEIPTFLVFIIPQQYYYGEMKVCTKESSGGVLQSVPQFQDGLEMIVEIRAEKIRHF